MNQKNFKAHISNRIHPIIGYLFVGGSAAMIDWSIFAILVFLLDVNYLISATFSFIFATLANYILGIKTIFTSGVNFSQKKEISLVFLVSVIGLVINLSFLAIFSEILNLNLMASKIGASFIAFAWNYISRMHFIFKKTSL